MLTMRVGFAIVAVGLFAISVEAGPKSKTGDAPAGGPAGKEWDGTYTASAPDQNSVIDGGFLCPGDGRASEGAHRKGRKPSDDDVRIDADDGVKTELNKSVYTIKDGQLTFDIIFLDLRDGPKNGRRVIKATVPLVKLSAAQVKASYDAATMAARGDTWIKIPPIKLDSGSYDKLHVTAKLEGLAPKGTDRALMGTGRSGTVIARLGGEDGAIQCSGEIQAKEFKGPDLSKGKFCSRAEASCTYDAQCCSKSCANDHEGALGHCE